ncbi:ATP12-domain-containing protein [Russula earlei]|uniref:ATP12-domain-containing protein n=1 Tax=Russula earlei TaxID=71964 RepID=A0ACC0U1S8_9AGAM|nr:ATP12-domain-containing protein [Russula earlei]
MQGNAKPESADRCAVSFSPPRLAHAMLSLGRTISQVTHTKQRIIWNPFSTEPTSTRFWKTVDLRERGDALTIMLDSRSLKTPLGKPLFLPRSKRLAATLIVAEWKNQRNVLKSHALPMTSLVARAIDTMHEATTREDVHNALLKYLDTDTICFHQDHPESLVRLQDDLWNPLLTWARDTFDVELLTFDSVLFHAQPDATKRKFYKVLQKFDAWQMAAMERVTLTTKSFIIALALVHGRITAEQAALASQVEVTSQIERWGEVEDSHDVDHHDVRRHIGSAACLLALS